MEYNSQRDNIIIPEYGRYVQKMIEYIRTLPEQEHRQAAIEKMVDMIQQMFPQSRSVEDYREKIWKQILRMAQFELDVVPPPGIEIEPLKNPCKPDKIPYPVSEARFRHYGNHVQRLVRKALEMEEGPKRDEFAKVIASYMKLAYRTWNKEHYVSDDVIKVDLASLSGGKLVVQDNASLDGLAQPSRGRSRQPEQRQSSVTSGNNKFRRGNHRNNKRR